MPTLIIECNFCELEKSLRNQNSLKDAKILATEEKYPNRTK